MNCNSQRGQFAVVEKIFEYKNHECICIFNKYGYRCGYVSVSENFNEEDDIDCHGGITFRCSPLPYQYGQNQPCFIGFDCGHFGDGIDLEQAREYGLNAVNIGPSLFSEENCVRSLEDVENECKKIVDQIENKYYVRK